VSVRDEPPPGQIEIADEVLAGLLRRHQENRRPAEPKQLQAPDAVDLKVAVANHDADELPACEVRLVALYSRTHAPPPHPALTISPHTMNVSRPSLKRNGSLHWDTASEP
jgi:hypothetical protein